MTKRGSLWTQSRGDDMAEWITLVEIRDRLQNDGIEITDRSLGRYRDEFMPTFQSWISGTGKRRRYNSNAIEAFKTVVDLKSQGKDRQAIQSQLDSAFGVEISESTDRPTTDRQDNEDTEKSLAITEQIRLSMLSIPKVIDRLEDVIKNQQKLMEQQAELIRKQDERITLLEQPWYRRKFRKRK